MKANVFFLFIVHWLLLTGVTHAVASVAVSHCETSDPVKIIQQFYKLRLNAGGRGLPDEQQLQIYRPYFSDALYQALQQARKKQLADIAAYPDEKPELIEGDLFSSLYEGITGMQVYRVLTLASNTVTVSVRMNYSETGSKAIHWQDRIVLLKESHCWKIDDILYGGDWDFANKGSLRAMTGN